MSTPPHLLLLAGSGEGRAVAASLAQGSLRVTASLADAAHWSGPLPVVTRHGGFGGEAGFRAFLRQEGVTAVLDATHPFAAQISARSWAICHEMGVPYLQIDRPAWVAEPRDHWTEVPDEAAAAAQIRTGARVFATIGRPLIGPFTALQGIHVFVRRLTATPAPPDFKNVTYVPGSGPFSVSDELRTFRELGISVLVCKNSGGQPSRTKLAAARRLGLPVILLQRPPATGAPCVDHVADALAWVQRTCR